MESKQESSEGKKVLFITRQLVHRKLASFSLNNNLDDIYCLIEAIFMIKNDLGIKLENEKRLIKLMSVISYVKSYYDDIKRYTKLKDDTKNKKFLKYQEIVTKVPVAMNDVYKALYVVVRACNIKDLEIPNQAFIEQNIAKHNYTIDMKGNVDDLSGK